MRGLLLWALLGLALPAAAAPHIEFDAAASVAFPSLAVPRGVRATGMGEAYTAAGDDVYALQWNPAGLAALRDLQLGFADNQWNSALGVRQNMLTYGQAMSPGSGAALALDYFNLGTLEQRDANGGLLGSAAASAFSGTLGYGRSLVPGGKWRAGLAAEYVQQTLYGSTQAGYGGGLGLLYDLSHGLTAGLAFSHLGVGLQGFNLPSQLQAGLALRLSEPRLTLAAEAQVPFSSSPLISAGAELEVSSIFLRGGYRQSLGGPDSAVQSGLSAGAGFKVGLLRLDYSFTPYSDLAMVHRVQATVGLPRDFFGGRVVAMEGTSATAEAYYKTAYALEGAGETLKALVQYQRCVENYPEALRAQPQTFYVDALKKVEELQASLAKGGDHEQIKRLTREALAAAEAEVKAGRIKDAIARLEDAQRMDMDDPDLEEALRSARLAQQARLSGFRNAARTADKSGNLVSAVSSYIKLLALEPQDPEATAYMAKNRQRLKAVLQAMDRRAIYDYVGGKLAPAIKTWTEGDALDYFGDLDFKRNLGKARKQMELRGN